MGLISGGLITRGLLSGGLITRGLISGGLISRGLISGGLISRGLISGGLDTVVNAFHFFFRYEDNPEEATKKEGGQDTKDESPSPVSESNGDTKKSQ